MPENSNIMSRKSVLPLLHLDDLVPVEAPHLELPVEVPHGQGDQVLVCDPALHQGIREP